MHLTELRDSLLTGHVIPACPLALTSARKLDEKRQRALIRYYTGAGSGGLAVGVHTTQFAIRDAKHGLFAPVMELAVEELKWADVKLGKRHLRIGGVCGKSDQAIAEAKLLHRLGYDAALLSLGAMRTATEDDLIQHCQAVSEVLPIVGFYLQPAVGGRVLPLSFWRRLVLLPNVVAIKIAPFNRYQTLDVIRALAESGRDDIALYTGNDDNIVLDLLTPHTFAGKTVRFVGGLLGHWSVWTKNAVVLHQECRRISDSQAPIPVSMMKTAIEVTDSNSAFFDAAHQFSGCIAGLHEVLRRQGLVAGLWCLDPQETLSPGQLQEIDRVYSAYDEFVAQHLDDWLR
jgi:dihydrodipicolinate synthase/N-acetylneuraminate lyase